MNTIEDKLEKFSRYLLPRILTQVCRDPNCEDWGAFDRNWWHYKIRDFPSVILQQGGYALFCAAQCHKNKKNRDGLIKLAGASCLFWNDRAVKHGAFEEYYPWEQGYPPLAFSTLAVAKLVSAGVVSSRQVYDGLKIASKQLLCRFEGQATNQQVAGMAALCWIRKISPELVNENELRELCTRTLACQHEEGWYKEYGGPDLGYLSVTMDCLWDAYDATEDICFRDSAAKALKFIDHFVSLPQAGAGMFNARNTDYIVPYGIARFTNVDGQKGRSLRILRRLFDNLEDEEHFFHAVDDRYFCHYIGHSVFRALETISEIDLDLVEKDDADAEINLFFEGTGHWLMNETSSGCAAMVAGRKGGVFSLDWGGRTCADYGWVLNRDGRQWVSHWWGDFWKLERNGDVISVYGHFVAHKDNRSTPVKHMLLRVLSLLFGRRIIGLLKERMIFKNNQNKGIPFERHISFAPSSVKVTDRIGINNKNGLIRAPRTSKRHVASADSFHKEDYVLVDSELEIDEEISQCHDCLQIITRYREKTTL